MAISRAQTPKQISKTSKIKKVIKGLGKAVKAHTKQAKTLQSVITKKKGKK
tara:strand:- start:578 stop:730 length:153 start_codon:yes stop_codon:yes gene_type:complete